MIRIRYNPDHRMNGSSDTIIRRGPDHETEIPCPARGVDKIRRSERTANFFMSVIVLLNTVKKDPLKDYKRVLDRKLCAVL